MQVNEVRSTLENYRKTDSQYSGSPIPANPNQPNLERQPFVDTIHQDREKKWFFDTVESQSDYFPFGAPGNGGM